MAVAGDYVSVINIGIPFLLIGMGGRQIYSMVSVILGAIPSLFGARDALYVEFAAMLMRVYLFFAFATAVSPSA